MADYLTLPGCRTVYVSELRQRADALLHHGKHEEGSLLHALLDGFLEAQGLEPVEIKREKRDLERELAESEEAKEAAESRVEFLEDAIASATEKLSRALGALSRHNPNATKAAVVDALGELAGTDVP